MSRTDIYDVLYRLGLTKNYAGFFYLSHAVWLAMENPDRLLLVTKWLYPDVVRQYHVTWRALERGIRYVMILIWKMDAELLREIICAPHGKKPTPAQFISMFADYCAAHRVA